MPVVTHVSVAPPGLAGRSPWTPVLLGAAVVGWWDAQDPAGITESSGAVAAWASKAAGGPSLAQATAADRPAWSATGWDGTRPAVTFGPADTLIGSAASALGGTFTLIAAAQPTTSQFRTALGVGVGVAGQGAGIGYSSAGYLHTYIWGGAERRRTQAPARAILVGSTSSVALYADGSEATEAATGSQTASIGQTVTLGGLGTEAFVRNGTLVLGEALIVSRVLTTDERQRTEGYLAHRWGLAANLPAGHPWKGAAPN